MDTGPIIRNLCIQSSFRFIERNSSCQSSILYAITHPFIVSKLYQIVKNLSKLFIVFGRHQTSLGHDGQQLSSDFIWIFPFLSLSVWVPTLPTANFFLQPPPFPCPFFSLLFFLLYPVSNVFASSFRLSLKGIYQSIVNFTSSKPKQFSFHSM